MVDPKDKNLSLPLANVMTRDIMHAVPSYGFFNAVKMLDEKKISCLPVVDEEENFVGILTVNDVMRALLTAYELSEKSQANPEPMPLSVGVES
jgi:CBS-domain-containing membrane protein